MRRLRLRSLLAVLVLATTIPVAAFAAWLISRLWLQQQAQIDRQNVEQARAIVVAVDQEIEATIATLDVLSLLDPIDAPDKSDFSAIAARVVPLHRGWQSIRLIDTNLRVVASTSGPPANAPLLDFEWVRAVLRTGKPSVSTVVLEPVSGQWTIAVGVPVTREGRVRYVLGARLYARSFSEILGPQKSPPEGVVTIVDASQHIVARTRNEDKYVGRPAPADFAERSRRSEEGSWRTTMLEGTPAYSSWSRSGLNGWTVAIGLPATPLDAPLRRSFLQLVAAGLAVCAVGVALALLLGRRLVRAQEAAAAAARALASGSAPPAYHSNITEVGELFEGLRQASGILDSRLRERDEAQAEADRSRSALLDREKTARRAAEALNRAKDEFIATVSHELRTPLNAIFGWVAMLRTGSLDADKQKHAIEVIERNTRAQAQVIEDLLDMSRAIRGSVRLSMEPLDLSAVLEAAIESLRPTADARQITVRADAPHGVAFVSADPGRLQQILWNILSNALKFTAPGGRIEARVSAGDGQAVIRIRDSGEGIAPEFLPHVFDRFRQENAEVTRTHSGLGLGLSLVRHLVELHGGSIAAESDGKGSGATFTITFPLLGAGTAGAQGGPSTAATVPVDSMTLNGMLVLVVDDEADARELAAEALGQAGAHVVTAGTADEATVIVSTRHVDAVVADIGLPRVSGYELATRLRRNPQGTELPLIALTAFGGTEDRDAALRAGFSAYIRKPYDPRALAALVAGLIAARHDAPT